MTSAELRRLKKITYDNLNRKYQNLFINEFKINGLDYRVDDYFMRKILATGTIAAFNLETGMEETNTIHFGSYSGVSLNKVGDPYQIRLVNEFNYEFIPSRNLINNEEAVILHLGFIPQKYITEYVQRLVDIDMTILTNVNLNKMPFIIKSTDKKTIKAIIDLLDNHQIVQVDDNMFQIFDTNIPYVIDKLSLYKQEVEAELLSVLGIDGVKFEKKAQMTKDEVNANDDEIDAYRKTIRQRLEAFFNQCNEVLGSNITLEKDKDEIYQEEEEEEEGVEEDV